MTTAETSITSRNKATVRRLAQEILNGGQLGLIDEIYAPELAAAAREWITPFRASFPDVQMDIIDLIAEGDTVAAHFTCSATHTGPWLGHPPTGRRPPVREHRRDRHLPAPRRQDRPRLDTGRHPHPADPACPARTRPATAPVITAAAR